MHCQVDRLYIITAELIQHQHQQTFSDYLGHLSPTWLDVKLVKLIKDRQDTVRPVTAMPAAEDKWHTLWTCVRDNADTVLKRFTERPTNIYFTLLSTLVPVPWRHKGHLYLLTYYIWPVQNSISRFLLRVPARHGETRVKRNQKVTVACTWQISQLFVLFPHSLSVLFSSSSAVHHITVFLIWWL